MEEATDAMVGLVGRYKIYYTRVIGCGIVEES